MSFPVQVIAFFSLCSGIFLISQPCFAVLTTTCEILVDQIAIQKLDRSTFTRPDAETASATVTSEGHEAPSFFKRGEFYYLIYGELCCFCRRGSNAKVHVSMNPMGPYQFVEQLNSRHHNENHVRAQNSDVIEVLLASGRIEYLWAADLWFSAKSQSKGDDHQYWEPLKFVERDIVFPGDGGKDVHVPVPIPTRFTPNSQWVDCFELSIPAGKSVQTRGEHGVLNPCPDEPKIVPSSLPAEL